MKQPLISRLGQEMESGDRDLFRLQNSHLTGENQRAQSLHDGGRKGRGKRRLRGGFSSNDAACVSAGITPTELA